MNSNQYTAGLEHRIEKGSSVSSFEHGFLNDVNSVFSLYEGVGREEEGGEKERRKVKAFQEYS